MTKMFTQPNVFRVFTKVGATDPIVKALHNVGVYSDVVNNGNVAKLIFIADSVDHVRETLKSAGVSQCEVFDVNTTDYNTAEPDKHFVKVNL